MFADPTGVRVSSETFPTVTADLERALADVRDYGYCVVAPVLSEEELTELRETLVKAAEEDKANGSAWYSNGNHKLFMLLNRGDVFSRLVQHPIALRLVADVLGPDALLSSVTANITQPGNIAQLLHTDQQYVREPWSYPATVNVLWMLDDFTEENGATRVVPRSHLIGAAPKDASMPTIPAVGPAGGLVLMDGRLWHGSGANVTVDRTRAAILAYYCMPFIRQQENVFRSLDPAIRRELSPELRKLLGYDVWSGLGVVNGFPRHWLGTTQRSGPTNADGIFPDGS
jgi:ectoine hydroxylase-related dioxygenase (phytanoyl-CoA dioxygenase family)